MKAIDAPGNVSQVASRPFTVDTRAPAVTMTSGPAGGSTTPDRSPSFSFASNEAGASFSCRLDGGGFEDCSSPSTASGLPDASHTFQVKAEDRAGNESRTASRTWTVDGPADVSITAGPDHGDPTSDPTPRFAFASADSSTSFSCRLDGGELAACTSPLTTPMLSDGDHRFTVKATSTTARDATSVSRRFIVDTAAPGAVITSGPADRSATNDPTPTFRFAPTEPGSTLQCHYEGQSFSGCSGASSDTPVSPLGDGPHTFWVRAVDAAGNRGDGIQVRLAVDTAPPELEIEGPRRVKTRRERAAVTFILSASELVGRRCRIDSRRYVSCSERYRTPKLRRGVHVLKVKATDRAGNLRTRRKRFKVARRDPPVVRADRPSTEGETETEARPIGASLLERAEQFVALSIREAAAFILHFEQHPVVAGVDAQDDAASRSGELEGVLQQIHHHRTQDLPVGFDCDAFRNRVDRQRDAAGLRREACRSREFLDECGDLKLFKPLNAVGESDGRQRAADEIVCAEQASMKHRTGTARDPGVARLEHFERDDRGVNQIPQFMSQEAELLGATGAFCIHGGFLAGALELGDRCRDGDIEASVQHAKVVRGNGGVSFRGPAR